jgi:hypothetical protein
MKTHSYLSIEDHRKYCPRLQPEGKRDVGMICEDCNIGGLISAKSGWGYHFICDTDKLMEETNVK